MLPHAAGFGAAATALPSRRTGASLPTQVPSPGRPALPLLLRLARPSPCSSVPASQRRSCSTGAPTWLLHLPGTSTMRTPGPPGEPNLLGQDCVVLGIPITWKLTHRSSTCQPAHNHLNLHGGRPGEAPRAPAPKVNPGLLHPPCSDPRVC